MSAFKKGFYKATQKVDVALKGSKKHYDDQYNDLDNKFEIIRKNLLELQDGIESYLEPRKSSKIRLNPNSKQSQNKDVKSMSIEVKVADSLSKCAGELDGHLSAAFNQFFEMFCKLSTAKESLESLYLDQIKADVLTRVIATGDEIRNVGRKVDNKRIAAQAVKMDKKSTEETKNAAQEAFNSLKSQRQGMLINYVVNSEPEYVMYISKFTQALEEYFRKCISVVSEFARNTAQIQKNVDRKERITVSEFRVPSSGAISATGMAATSGNMTGVSEPQHEEVNLFEQVTQQHQWGEGHPGAEPLPNNAGWGAPPSKKTAAPAPKPNLWGEKPSNENPKSAAVPFNPFEDNIISFDSPTPSKPATHNSQTAPSYNPFDIPDPSPAAIPTANPFDIPDPSPAAVPSASSNPFDFDPPVQTTVSAPVQTTFSAPAQTTFSAPVQSNNETRAHVIFDFEAENDDELTVKAGDIITIVERVDENWFVGRLGSKQGYVPREFIEIIT